MNGLAAPSTMSSRCDRLRGARVGFGLWWIFFDVAAPAAALRRAHRQPLDGTHLPTPSRSWPSRDDRPHRACARTADPGSYGVAARRLGRAPARRPRRHDPHARRLSAPRRHLSTARLRDGRRRVWPCSSAGCSRPPGSSRCSWRPSSRRYGCSPSSDCSRPGHGQQPAGRGRGRSRQPPDSRL